MVRLNKYLSSGGVCSRREADRLIESGRVTVDGKRAVTGMQVEPGQVVRVGKRIVQGPEEKIVLAVNKPAGIVCTEDMRVKNNIIRFLKYPVRVTYAGRLDKDSEGLLLMTNDGELIDRIMRGRYGHEKEYRVTVDRAVTEEFLRQMSEGVHIADKEKGLDAVTRPCRTEQIGKYIFSIVLTQGLNRQIRRMCESLGYRVVRLVRIRVMNIRLEGLKSGSYRKLTEQELKELYEQAEAGENAGTGKTAESGRAGLLSGR